MSVQVQVNKRRLQPIDFTPFLMEAGNTIVADVINNVSTSKDIHGRGLRPLSPAYAAWKSGRAPSSAKKKKLLSFGASFPVGHSKPLIAQHRSFVKKANYYVRKIARAKVQVGFVGQHPKAKMRVGQLAYIHNEGLPPQKRREFFGIGNATKKNIMRRLSDYVVRKFK